MNKDLIGISGKAGSGKNTVASFLQDIDKSFEQKAFAAKLKKIASILTGEPIQNRHRLLRLHKYAFSNATL